MRDKKAFSIFKMLSYRENALKFGLMVESAISELFI